MENPGFSHLPGRRNPVSTTPYAEATALFLHEEPTYAFFPPFFYYQGRVREGLNSTKAGESYRNYLDIRGRSTEDPLVPVVRNRAAAATAVPG